MSFVFLFLGDLFISGVYMICFWCFGFDDMYIFVYMICKGKINFDLKIFFILGFRMIFVLIIDLCVIELLMWVLYLLKKFILECGLKCVGVFVVIIIICWDIDFFFFEIFFRKRFKNNCFLFFEIFLYMGFWEVDCFFKFCWFVGFLGLFVFFNFLGCRNDC